MSAFGVQQRYSSPVQAAWEPLVLASVLRMLAKTGFVRLVHARGRYAWRRLDQRDAEPTQTPDAPAPRGDEGGSEALRGRQAERAVHEGLLGRRRVGLPREAPEEPLPRDPFLSGVGG